MREAGVFRHPETVAGNVAVFWYVALEEIDAVWRSRSYYPAYLISIIPLFGINVAQLRRGDKETLRA
jgi:hypothetical protein